jgi:hypothetical protein
MREPFDMGYLDDITDVYFKTAQDGRKVFFPWGILGRGYTIGSEQDFKQLRRQIKIYLVACLILLLPPALLLGQLAGFDFVDFTSAAILFAGYSTVVCAFLLVFYALWVRYPLRRMRPSEERLSRQDVISRARALSATRDKTFLGAAWLWLREIAVLALVGSSILILLVGSSDKQVTLAALLFSAAGAIRYSVMLFQRLRREMTNP